MNKRSLLGGLLATVLAATIFAHFSRHSPAPRTAPTAPILLASRSTTAAASQSSSSALDHSSQVDLEPVAGPPVRWRDRLKSDRDHFALALEALPRARVGDPEAQYVVFSTYRYCHGGNGSFITRWESLEQLREEAARNRDIEQHLEANIATFERCHGFYTADASRLGNPWDLLQRAVDAGYPPALEDAAYERINQLSAQAYSRAGVEVDSELANMPPIGGGKEPFELLVAAMRSGDPDAFLMTGSVYNSLRPDLSRDETRIYGDAWQYVGCQRGADCSKLGPAAIVDFGPLTITNCGPNDGRCTPIPALFMIRANYNWAPVQEVVNQINAALAAKQWDKLPGLAAGS